MNAPAWINFLAAILLAPLLIGVVTRVKAIFAGRDGQPLVQVYLDFFKLLRKGSVLSTTATWVFVAGPAVSLCAIVIALLIVPFGGERAIMMFPGDLIAFAYLLALARFFTVLAALDTGSAFEGMGASREVWFSSLAEVSFLIALTALARTAESSSLSGIYSSISVGLWAQSGPTLLLAMAAMFIVLLAENSRIPVDDPATHLELTMIHEVMVLDHGGPDFAFITLGSSIKLLMFCVLVAGLVPAISIGDALLAKCALVGCVALVAIAVGVVESMMARLKLVRVPQLLALACVLSFMALSFSFFVR